MSTSPTRRCSHCGFDGNRVYRAGAAADVREAVALRPDRTSELGLRIAQLGGSYGAQHNSSLVPASTPSDRGVPREHLDRLTEENNG